MASIRLRTNEYPLVSGPHLATLADFLGPFRIASPELLQRRTLLRRTCSKFVLRADHLPELLRRLSNDYAVLRAGPHRLAAYRTLYFDTPDLRCYHDHRRGRRPRHKVRIRHYPDRQVSFFEIKAKQSDLIVHKHRIDKPYGSDELGEREVEFLRQHCRPLAGTLVPQTWTNFRRLTLIGLHDNERVTIDTELQIGSDGALEPIDGVVIMEVKQKIRMRTPVIAALAAVGLRPTSSSKYCTAIAFTRSGIRCNRLLPALRAIERICR